jgi:hypothetical protein
MAIEQPFRLSSLHSSRPCREIIADLLREPNTGKMSGLLQELSESLDEQALVVRWTTAVPGARAARRVFEGPGRKRAVGRAET